MDDHNETFPKIEKQPETDKKTNKLGRNVLLTLLNFIVVLIVGAVFYWMGTRNQAPDQTPIGAAEATDTPQAPLRTNTPSATASLLPEETLTPSVTPTASSSPTLLPTVEEFDLPNGMMFLSLVDDGYTQIFAYHPANFGFTRLTEGSFEHRDPSVSPDGSQIAYAANPDGYWDLYILDILTGETTQITNDTAYDGAPSWSNDGSWLAYEKFIDNNLEIYILLTDMEDSEEIRLTINSSADFEPAWSPDGRKIAYTNNSAGGFDIWVADLDMPSDDRFLNITQNPAVIQSKPAWSADGRYLAWSSSREGYTQLYTLDTDDPEAKPQYAGDGEYPVWSPQGYILITPYNTAENQYLTGYQPQTGERVLPPVSMPTLMDGVSWGVQRLPDPLPASLAAIAAKPFSGIWTSEEVPNAGGALLGRELIIELPDVDAPYSELSALVIASFYELRDRLLQDSGWDVFASLENTFVPFNDSLNPGFENSWIYTGRAIAIQKTLLDAGWMLVAREDIGDTTYWRVFIRAAVQDGSQGMPLKTLTWDFDLRFSGDPEMYENGGGIVGNIKPGYWVDLTWLATAYGWERTPADSTWRRYIPATQFNVFVIKNGLSWHDAMAQIYPAEILLTPTFIPTYTPTATRTPWPTLEGTDG